MSFLYDKYNITKKDGSLIDPNAQYFVLRIDTDPAARHAVLMYASYIQDSDPEGANELRNWVLAQPVTPLFHAGDASDEGDSTYTMARKQAEQTCTDASHNFWKYWHDNFNFCPICGMSLRQADKINADTTRVVSSGKFDGTTLSLK